MSTATHSKCIFCLRSQTSFTKEAHIIPESAGNKELVLPRGYECDDCNQEFSVTEQQVMRSFPGQFFRVAFVENTKRGKSPTSDIKGGKLTRVETPERPTVQIKQYSQNPHAGKFTMKLDSSEVTWEGSALSASKTSAFLAKISLEYLCVRGADVYSAEYNDLRRCASSHESSSFIPFFIGLHAEPTQAIELLDANTEILEASRPVSVRFPGLYAIMPTTNDLQKDAFDRLQLFIHKTIPGTFLSISDPNWAKPIKTTLTLIPSSEVAKESHAELWKVSKRPKI